MLLTAYSISSVAIAKPERCTVPKFDGVYSLNSNSNKLPCSGSGSLLLGSCSSAICFLPTKKTYKPHEIKVTL